MQFGKGPPGHWLRFLRVDTDGDLVHFSVVLISSRFSCYFSPVLKKHNFMSFVVISIVVSGLRPEEPFFNRRKVQ